MEYIELQQLLREKNLECDNLNVLKADSDRYSVILMQPDPKITYDDYNVKNRDTNNPQYIEFLKLCRNQDIDLCLSPEYCQATIRNGHRRQLQLRI
jgi:hypothetical protein